MDVGQIISIYSYIQNLEKKSNIILSNLQENEFLIYIYFLYDILYNNYQKLTKSSHDKPTQKYYLNNGANERNNLNKSF